MKRVLFAFLFLTTAFAAIPLPVDAAMPIFDQNFELVPDPSTRDSQCQRGDPLSYGAVLQLVQNIFNASITAAAFIFILIVVYAGVLFLFSPANPGNREMGRTVLINAVIGFIIVISAWLIVDMVMKALYQPQATTSTGAKFGPWNEILSGGDDWCAKAVKTRSLLGKEVTSTAEGGGLVTVTPGQPTPTQSGGGTTTQQPTNPSGGGTTPPQTSNPGGDISGGGYSGGGGGGGGSSGGGGGGGNSQPPTPPVVSAEGPFTTQAEAARAALTYATPLSIRDNLEYGGLIYKDQSGRYWSGPVRGTDAGVYPYDAGSPSGSTVVGNYHTHGDYSLYDKANDRAIRTSDPNRDDYNSDHFSETDVKMITNEAKGNSEYMGYLGTPAGKFLYYDPRSRVEAEL